jgi:two-component system NarL family sensor kinase
LFAKPYHKTVMFSSYNLKYIIAFLTVFPLMLHGQKMSQRIEKEIDSFAINLEQNPEKAYSHLSKAYQKSVAIGSDSLIARSLCNMGYYAYLKKDYPLAKAHYTRAIAYSRKIKYFKILAYSYSQLGIMASNADQFDQALQYYLTALKYAEACKLPDIKSKTLINLGNLYLIQKDTVKGLEYYQQNIANAKEHGLHQLLGQGYITLAMMYASSNKPKSLSYYSEALRIVKENRDMRNEFIIHTNLGSFYVDYPITGHLKKAFLHIRESAKIQDMLHDESLLFFVYFNYGGYYLTQKKYQTALSYYQKALVLSSKNITSDQKLNLYKFIAKSYALNNDYKNAYKFQEQLKVLNDSVFNINKNIAFSEIQTKYEVEKKNLKIDLLSKEQTIERSKRQVVFVLAVAVAMPLLALTLFYRKKNSMQKVINANEHKLFEQEKLHFETQNEIEKMSGILEGQSAERDRIASEIHDGIGGELAGIKLHLHRINESLEDDKIASVINRLSGLFQELRNISHNLSSNFIKGRDFHSALLELKGGFEDRNEFNLEIVIYPEDIFERLSEPFTHEVYRIIQELLANVSKHAEAKLVSVTITQHSNFLNIIVEDDGVGFQSGGVSGIGLKNIADRLKSMQGTLNIESIVGNGSFIIVDIPQTQ